MLECVIRNLNNPEINLVTLVLDSEALPNDFRHNKLMVIQVEARPTYSLVAYYANKMVNSPSDISIICNGDIYFTQADIRLIKASLHKDQAYALSRWDVLKVGLHHHSARDSQDAWIFKGKIRSFNGEYNMGKPGCDNRVAYELECAGYEVINPSKTIRCYHLHQSNSRTYIRTSEHIVPEPYAMVDPEYLYERLYPKPKNRTVAHGSVLTDEQGNIKYDAEAQKKTMKSLLVTGNYDTTHDISICIPTMHSRKEMFDKLHKELMRQILGANAYNRVQIYPYRDNGQAPIGYKRNHCNIHCSGKYVIHLDDDDWVSEDYIEKLLNAIDKHPMVDCVTFDVELTYDGENPEIMHYDIKYKKNRQVVTNDGTRLRERIPSHINLIRRDKALMHSFKVIGVGATRQQRNDSGSDVVWSMELVENQTLTSHYHIDKVLYYYRYIQNKKS